MIRWQKMRANEFPRWIFECLSAIGLSFLIHIHRNPRVLFIWKYSLMSEGMSSGRPESQFYVWRKMLEGTNTRKEVFTLFQPKVSTAFGKLSFNFVHKVTRVRTVTQAKNTCTRCSLWASLHLEPVQQKGYHEFRVSCATFQVRTIGMILWQIIMLCNGLPNAERKTLGKGIRQIIQDSRDKKYATCTKAKMRSTILTWQQNYHPFWFLKLVTA